MGTRLHGACTVALATCKELARGKLRHAMVCRRFLVPAVTVLALVFVASCEHVKAPEIQPEKVVTSKITPQGADVETTLAIYNPNKSTLTANGVDTKVTIGGRPNVARAVVTEILTMPGGQRISVKMPIRVQWT